MSTKAKVAKKTGGRKSATKAAPVASGFKVIGELELAAMLAAKRGCQVVTITTRTVPTMRKTGNPYYGATVKVARVNGMVNWQYESAVNNQRAREGNAEYFEAAPRQWGERLPGLPFVHHKGQLYLELKVERSLDHQYFVNGVPTESKYIEEHIPQRDGSGRQEVERAVILRDYKLCSIEQIQVGGELYVIDHAKTATADDLIAATQHAG